MDNGNCPKCGSAQREQGNLYVKGSLWDIRFLPDAASPLSYKKLTAALACPECGYLELYVSRLASDNPSEV